MRVPLRGEIIRAMAALDAVLRDSEFFFSHRRRATESQWTTLTLAAGWTVPSGDRAPAVNIDPDGIVRLRGVAHAPSGGTSRILTLPAGYRPAKLEVPPRASVHYTGAGAIVLDGYIYLESNGDVEYVGAGSVDVLLGATVFRIPGFG